MSVTNFMTMFFTLIFLFIISGVTSAQISPGELTKAHAQLEGMSNCTKCHVLGEQVYNSKCLDCHTEVKSLINNGRGYHASAEVKGKDCWSCHSEHHGRNFQIVRFDKNKFDHNKAGYTLTGAHEKKDCQDCHKNEFIKDQNLKKRKNTFLGLDQKCLSCHTDVHQKSLGEDCKSCHNNDFFKPASLFEHNKAAFKLTGQHIKAECAACHKIETINGKKFQKFKKLQFANCTSCHTDPHQGRFGADCQKCHTTADFKQVKAGSFDHNKTKFPLLGKHVVVACNDCHKGSLSTKPKFALCSDCHKDAHKGQFMEAGQVRDCAKCHTVPGFSPSQFTLDEHNKAGFKLEGAHLSIPCFACHKKGDDWVFKPIEKNCTSCHKNVHDDEISVEFGGSGNCTKCHSVEKWTSVSFDHATTQFKLLGKHKNAKCMDCHKAKSSEQKYLFKSLTANCIQCHEDIHHGQFAGRGEKVCESCHGFERWKPTSFNHGNTKFPLDGAHSKVACAECHRQVTKDTYTFTLYSLPDFKCVACHK